jgi:stearoyl-CoA desaturase (delta-9 desaturase)
MTNTKRINWTVTLFLILTPLIAVIGTAIIIVTGRLNMATVYLALVFMIITGLCITAGYHRLFSHRSYRAAWPVRLFYLLFGAAAFEGSVLEWSTDHRRHHLYVDTEKDPYNINEGFWHAHMGWLFFLDPSKRNFKNVKDLSEDSLVHFQHRFFTPIAIIMGFFLPIAIASIWNDPWGGFFIAGGLRIVINQQLTFCINSVCHVFGIRNYSEKQTARDNWFTAFFTYGEGFHNFHHQFMFDYRNGIRFYHYDPAKWLIKLLAVFHLAKDLKRANSNQILRYSVQIEETHAFSKIGQYSASLRQHIEHFMQSLRESVLQAARRLDQSEKDYLTLKENKTNYLKGKMSEYHNLIKIKKKQLKAARYELSMALGRWRQFIKHPISTPISASH